MRNVSNFLVSEKAPVRDYAGYIPLDMLAKYLEDAKLCSCETISPG